MTTGKKTISAATPPDTVLVVGATSSLAQALCRAFAREGRAVLLAGRDEHELELLASDLHVRYGVPCGVLTVDFLAPGFSSDSFIAQAGNFNHAVIAIGDMGGDDPADPANIAATARINYVIPAQIAASAAAFLIEKRKGTVAIISSVAGDRGRQSNFAYGSAKAALSAFASGLRNLYFPHGVHVMTIKPGFIDTPMTWGMQSPLIAGRDYAAAKILKAMEKKKDVIYVPFFWRFIMLIICSIPEKIFKKLRL